MSLPNPAMSFTPFDILTAEEMNNLVENIESLSDGTGFEADSIPKSAIDFDDGIWWEEIGRLSLTPAGDTLAITGLTAKKWLRIMVTMKATGGTIVPSIRLNADSGANYNFRYLVSGTGGTSNSATSWGTIDSSSALITACIDIYNVAAEKKTMSMTSISVPANVATNVLTSQFWGVWHNTANAVSGISFLNGGTGDFAIGSEIIVLGHD